MFILHLEQKFVGVVVEGHVADPRNKYGDSLQNLRSHVTNRLQSIVHATFDQEIKIY